MKRCGSSSCISSGELVSNCDDLLTEILLPLPLHSAFQFKCVSKSWNHLMSDPIFCTRYQSRRKNSIPPLLGFFRVTLGQDYLSTLQLSFLRNPEQPKLTKLDYIEGYNFSHISPEGLILCNVLKWGVYHYYVCNPVRNQWFGLPQPRNEHDPQPMVGFVCEECSKDGVVHFKVIFAMFCIEETAIYDSIYIQTFSSRTGVWSESFLTPPFEFSLGNQFDSQTVGGIMYWNVTGHLVAYDPGMRENRVWLIELPPQACKRDGRLDGFILGQSADGCLRFALNDRYQFRVWNLKEKLSSYDICRVVPSSEWRLKEVVPFNKLNIINYCATGHSSHIRNLNKYPRLRAFHPRNSELVYLHRGSVMFCYDFETRRLERIKYTWGTISPTDQVYQGSCTLFYELAF